MLNIKSLRQKEEGFTIIEVLIVLAIAALILLIVFLAVPALQRSSRNNARKNDAARVGTEVANFASDNNGLLPGNTTLGTYTAGQFNTDCTSIANNLGNLSQFGNAAGKLQCAAAFSAVPVQNTFAADGAVGALTVDNSTSNYNWNWVLIDEQAQCPTSYGNKVTTQGGNVRQSVILYPQETGTGGWNVACIAAT